MRKATAFLSRRPLLGVAAALFLAMPSACSRQAAESSGARVAEDQTVILFNTLPIRRDALESFLTVMRANIADSRAEAGNISFDACQREEGGTDVFLIERWESQTALDEHMRTPHLRAVADALSVASATPDQSVRLRRCPIPPQGRR